LAESPVPDAVGRVLQGIRDRLDGDRIDQIWIFPPLIRGRREWGLVAVSGLTRDPGRRTLLTARYSAELRGSGGNLEYEVQVEGDAPPDRLPRVMDGVVRRSNLRLGDPRRVDIRGDRERLRELVREYGGVDPSPDPGG
jgi:hypothetical protein